jgi:1-acyl-sn-glycerol-3-phosphate acyltransferase
MRALRTAVRVGRILVVVAYGLVLAAGFIIGERLGLAGAMARRQRWTRSFMTRLTRALPFTVRIHGAVPPRPMLWISNHVSWTDIALLGQIAPLSFLSKAEVRHWPVAGWLAQHAGTLFIRRGANDSQRLRREMALRLEDDCPLLIFPEGTTTDGRQLRTFHGRMLACAADVGVAIQPVAIRYGRGTGLDPIAPFIGDDDLLSHLLRLLRADAGVVDIHLLEPIETQGVERAVLAFKAQEAVRMALFGERRDEGPNANAPQKLRGQALLPPVQDPATEQDPRAEHPVGAELRERALLPPVQDSATEQGPGAEHPVGAELRERALLPPVQDSATEQGSGAEHPVGAELAREGAATAGGRLRHLSQIAATPDRTAENPLSAARTMP